MDQDRFAINLLFAHPDMTLIRDANRNDERNAPTAARTLFRSSKRRKSRSTVISDEWTYGQQRYYSTN